MRNPNILGLAIVFLIGLSACQSTKSSERSTSKDAAADELSEIAVVSYPKAKPSRKDKKRAADALESRVKGMEVTADVAYEEVADISPSSYHSVENKPAAGKLTAGILNDFGKWNLWQDIQENELKQWQETWSINPSQRYPIQLTTEDGFPVVNATARLKKGKQTIWTAVTDNTGKAELWANIYETQQGETFAIEIEYKGKKHYIESAQDFHEGGNIKAIPTACEDKAKVEIAFVVDATGSMSDEIEYLKSELTDVIERSKKTLKNADFRVASVFYRDEGEDYVTKKFDFNTKIAKTLKFIEKQEAAGGGDSPEAVEAALATTLNDLSWRKTATSRIAFLVLDAPPHEDKKTKKILREQIEAAAKRGIRIVPVACSGTDRSTEYIMRSIALATNGSYIYLTDDSGIGGSHMKPITDEHKTVMLNDLLVETITNFSTLSHCKQPLVDETLKDTMQVVHQTTTQDSTGKELKTEVFTWTYYPNPTIKTLNIKITGTIDYIYFADNSGKILQRIEVKGRDFVQLDVAQYPAGMYYLKGIQAEGKKDITGKVILVRA